MRRSPTRISTSKAHLQSRPISGRRCPAFAPEGHLIRTVAKRLGSGGPVSSGLKATASPGFLNPDDPSNQPQSESDQFPLPRSSRPARKGGRGSLETAHSVAFAHLLATGLAHVLAQAMGLANL